MGTNLFPLWVLSFSLLGFIRPNLFLWFAPLVTAALTLTMICMGMTLTVSDFKNVASSWRLVLLGFVAQYTIMPFSAAALSRVMGLSPELASGLILVGCAPGGTASNLVTMIAKADLALSILMTAASTVAAVVMTPLLVTRLAGEYVSIKANDLVLSTLSVVLLPVAVGLGLNTNFPVFCSRSAQYTPFLSVLLVALICGSISASNSGIVKGVLSAKLLAAIVALHSIGFLVGYLFARVGGANESQSRTISIETGMQNSALAVVLAKHFPNPQLCALPGSLSATIHSIIGSLLAALWRWRSAKAAANKQTASS
ncbi:bile acid:sodium symporter [Ochromonadaceae sp. CCMP2298]|nr:bile acid:sodium symporter [Ochromonadaceae sp. CCMP2298]